MNSIITRLASTARLLFFSPYFIWRNKKARYITILFFASLFLSGCFQHYFRVVDSKTVDAATIYRLQSANKYFIMHFRNGVTGLSNIKVSGETLEADLITVAPEHGKYLDPEMGRPNRVKKIDKQMALIEVHLYSLESFSVGQTHLSIPLSALNGIDVYEFDQSATTANHILSWVGVVLTATTVFGFIAFAIACNCPQVYVNNNGQYEFKSGVYSGAIHSGLERTDWLALPGITPVNNKYQFKIGNVPNEEQFINQVQLLKVEHPVGMQVLADRHGKILTYGNATSAISATYNDGTDISAQLKYTDGQYYFFDSNPNSDGFSSVTMNFNKPANSSRGKLLVHAGNSAWSGYLFHEFESLFGGQFEKWRRQQEIAGPVNADKWTIDQGLPMKVYVETENGWQYVDHFALTGNTASRDMIMEIDLTGVKKDKVNIRIESTYQFWNLDMAAMDFSDNSMVTTTVLDPVRVVKNDKEDTRGQLLQSDKEYCHLLNNDFINLEYEAPASSDNASYFLVSSGYYHTNPPKDGKTDLKALLEFKEKGAFDRFSRNKFAIVQNAFVKTDH